nr:zinc finger, CCHC-type [Tanacetum cinerariifolium]
MGDENPIRTLGDHSKPNHNGYRNTIKIPDGNNVVPLRSNTIRLEGVWRSSLGGLSYKLLHLNLHKRRHYGCQVVQCPSCGEMGGGVGVEMLVEFDDDDEEVFE